MLLLLLLLVVVMKAAGRVRRSISGWLLLGWAGGSVVKGTARAQRRCRGIRITHRIARLEDRTNVGFDRDGHCRYCHGREKELGGQHVVRRENDPFPELTARFQSPRPDPGPTPCPRCGRDMNTYVVVNYVSRLTPEQEERAAEISAERGW